MKKLTSSEFIYGTFSLKTCFAIFCTITVGALSFPSMISAQNKVVNQKNIAIPAISLSVKAIASGIQAPTAMVFPDNQHAWITEQSGKVRVIENGKLLVDPLIDVASKMFKLSNGYEERGLLGITVNPQFKINKKVYLYYDRSSSLGSNHTGVLAEYKFSEATRKMDLNSERIILTVEEPDGNHNGGCIQFGPDGYLYLSLGDGGGQGDQHGKIGNGQDMTSWHGKILRIDVDSESGYKVPKDNPFVGRAGIKPEIWAFGFRNPWRFSFDKVSGQMFAGDVGQSTWEEVDIVKKGGNYGWRLMEGTHCYNPETGCDITKTIMPIAEYHHSEGVSITGGYIYNGTEIPQIKSKYIFADWTGRIYYLQKSGAKWNRGKISIKNIAENSKITAFGEDPSGELYMLTNTDTGPENKNGTIYKIVKN